MVLRRKFPYRLIIGSPVLKGEPTEGPGDFGAGPAALDRPAEQLGQFRRVDIDLVRACHSVPRDLDLVDAHDGIECQKAISDEGRRLPLSGCGCCRSLSRGQHTGCHRQSGCGEELAAGTLGSGAAFHNLVHARSRALLLVIILIWARGDVIQGFVMVSRAATSTKSSLPRDGRQSMMPPSRGWLPIHHTRDSLFCQARGITPLFCLRLCAPRVPHLRR